MLKLVLWGAGLNANWLIPKIQLYKSEIKIEAICDKDSSKWGKELFGIRICEPCKIKELKFDQIVVTSAKYYDEICEELTSQYDVDAHSICEFNSVLKPFIMSTYRNTTDVEIIDILKYLSENDISPYNQYVKFNQEMYYVEWDNVENLPYVWFEDKRMYFPASREFAEFEGKKVVWDILAEQQPNSPHLYLDDKINILDGDVIVDAGVCEGNFALRYIEKVSKAYLIECDEEWIRPLEKTFEKFKNKVVLSRKFLGRYDDGKSTNLDTLVGNNRVDFLKMDIEGAEVDALLGADNTLSNNNVKCSICSYHRHNDEKYIRMILGMHGYSTYTTKGYMSFLGDIEMFIHPEFRRGIVHGIKA